METQNPRRRMYFKLDQCRAEANDTRELPDIVGHAIVYNVVGDAGIFSEEINKGAVTKSLDKNPDVVSLFNHNQSLVLGRTPDTLELKEDDVGLWTRTRPIATQTSRDLVALIKENAIRHMSFGFYVIDETTEKRNGKLHFVIREIELFDVSPVTFPFYKQTDVSVRSSEDLANRIERAQKKNAEADFMKRHAEILRKKYLS